MPRRGEEHADGQAPALDGPVQEAPELVLPPPRDERIDQHGSVGRLEVDAEDVLRPVLVRLPLGVRRHPVGEARRKLGEVHDGTSGSCGGMVRS